MTKSRALFLDRDGVINVDHNYVSEREKFEFMPGLFPFLRAAQDRGFRLVIVTNQSGVARGLYTEEDYETLTAWMLKEFKKEEIAIDLVLACFEIKDGEVARYRRESFWRKPNPGMVLDAAQRLRLDLPRSAMIGDRERDILAALGAGVGTCLWLAPAGSARTMPGVTNIKDFTEALQVLAASD
jgi:D-glycero-D-manno-heptose 1,7-bisphosphate phosphatase